MLAVNTIESVRSVTEIFFLRRSRSATLWLSTPLALLLSGYLAVSASLRLPRSDTLVPCALMRLYGFLAPRLSGSMTLRPSGSLVTSGCLPSLRLSGVAVIWFTGSLLHLYSFPAP